MRFYRIRGKAVQRREYIRRSGGWTGLTHLGYPGNPSDVRARPISVTGADKWCMVFLSSEQHPAPATRTGSTQGGVGEWCSFYAL